MSKNMNIILNSESKFQSVWEYEIIEKFRAEFIEAYSSNGAWVKLFKQCNGYIKTELKKDVANPSRFLTIDYWQSESSFNTMKKIIKNEYNKLDKKCEVYTISEKHIGFFCEENIQLK